MKHLVKHIVVTWIVGAAALASADFSVSYQGRLTDGGNPVNGTYEMFFVIFDAPTDGTQLDFVNLTGVPVVDGYFTVELDFPGPQVFSNDNRWVEIRVTPAGGLQTILQPRQPVKPVPRSLRADYSVHSISVVSPVVKAFDPQFPEDITLALDFAFVQRVDTLETLVADQAAVIAALQSQITALQAEVTTLTDDVAAVQSRVATVEDVTDTMTLTSIDGYPSLVVEGVNLHLRNGLGSTNTDNGTGNLIVGYNELRAAPLENIRTGSHLVITGREQNYTGSSGFIGGYKNSSNADYGAILGGMENETFGLAPVVVGGLFNTAGNPNDPNDAFYAVAVGGYNNIAMARGSAILAGQNNVTLGDSSGIMAGNSNQTAGTRSAIVSGFSNQANGSNSVILGGGIGAVGIFGDNASGNAAVVVGGYRNESTGTYATTVGGFVNKSSNTYTVTSSGFNRDAAAEGEWVSSGYSDSDF